MLTDQAIGRRGAAVLGFVLANEFENVALVVGAENAKVGKFGRFADESPRLCNEGSFGGKVGRFQLASVAVDNLNGKAEQVLELVRFAKLILLLSQRLEIRLLPAAVRCR